MQLERDIILETVFVSFVRNCRSPWTLSGSWNRGGKHLDMTSFVLLIKRCFRRVSFARSYSSHVFFMKQSTTKLQNKPKQTDDAGTKWGSKNRRKIRNLKGRCQTGHRDGSWIFPLRHLSHPTHFIYSFPMLEITQINNYIIHITSLHPNDDVMKHLSNDVINPSRCGRRPFQLLTTHLVKFNDSEVKGHRSAFRRWVEELQWKHYKTKSSWEFILIVHAHFSYCEWDLIKITNKFYWIMFLKIYFTWALVDGKGNQEIGEISIRVN